MRTKLLYFILLIFVFLNQYAISQRTCGSEINFDKMSVDNPIRYQKFLNVENQLNRLKTTQLTTKKIIIPVVVHVLHNGENLGVGLNISVSQIQSQIDVLNEDFRRLNSDKTLTPTAFQSVVADVEIEFKLATVDPNGNYTDGIIRKSGGKAIYTLAYLANGDIDEVSTGIKYDQYGSSAWAPDKYLNLWVCNLGSGILGYSQFPADFSTSPNTDGVVIRTQSFGRTGNVTSPFDKGRTATHEVGHWLNLFHIWGDKIGCNNGTDYCDDTPDQYNMNYNCSQNHQSCTSTGDMFMNYMDYTDDGCMNLFTQNQKTRMQNLFVSGGIRESIFNSGQNMFSPPVLSGPSQICTQGTCTLSNLAAGATVVWSATPSDVVSLQPSGSSVILARVSGGNVTLSATINNSYTVTKDIWVGVPSTPTSIGGFASNGLKFASVSQYSFYVRPEDVEGVNQYSWTVRSGSGTILDGQGTPVINFETADIANSLSFYVSVKVGNSCGWSSTFTRSGTIDGGIGQQSPKSKELFNESVQAIEEVRDEANYNVLICDQLGRVVLQTTQKGADFSTSTSKIANGTYIVKLYNDKASMQKKVVVNHLR